MYNTHCLACGAEALEVCYGDFAAYGMRLTADGFAFADARQVDTEDEGVWCAACFDVRSLAAYTVEE